MLTIRQKSYISDSLIVVRTNTMELLNVQIQIEDNDDVWFKITLQLASGISSWEILSNVQTSDDVLEEVLKIVPMMIKLNAIEYQGSRGAKVDMSNFNLFHAQINQFVARNQFRNVDVDDFLATSVLEDHRKNFK